MDELGNQGEAKQPNLTQEPSQASGQPQSKTGNDSQAESQLDNQKVQVEKPVVEVQQPHLIKTGQIEKKKLPVPPTSFLIAVLTIIVTIVLGILIARVLKGMTQQQVDDNQQLAPSPTVVQSTASQEAVPLDNFGNLLNPQNTAEATQSYQSESTQEALPFP